MILQLCAHVERVVDLLIFRMSHESRRNFKIVCCEDFLPFFLATIKIRYYLYLGAIKIPVLHIFTKERKTLKGERTIWFFLSQLTRQNAEIELMRKITTSVFLYQRKVLGVISAGFFLYRHRGLLCLARKLLAGVFSRIAYLCLYEWNVYQVKQLVPMMRLVRWFNRKLSGRKAACLTGMKNTLLSICVELFSLLVCNFGKIWSSGVSIHSDCDDKARL